jgi:hypothetical protein
MGFSGKSNDYGNRSERLRRFAGQTGILTGTRQEWTAKGQALADADAVKHNAPFARWNLDKAFFTPNNTEGAIAKPLHHFDHFSVIGAKALNTDGDRLVAVEPHTTAGRTANWPVSDPMAMAPPPIGTEVRMPVAIVSRNGNREILSPTPAPGVFNDQLALRAVNAALAAGLPPSQARRAVQRASHLYDQFAEQELMYYMASDAIARELIARAGEIPLSNANRTVLEAARRHLQTLPEVMPSPFGISL